MKLSEARLRAKEILDEIFESGDQDECAIKHIGHGTSLIMMGLDPCNQENYADYNNAGFGYFNPELWYELKKLSDKYKTLFHKLPPSYSSLYLGNYCFFYEVSSDE